MMKMHNKGDLNLSLKIIMGVILGAIGLLVLFGVWGKVAQLLPSEENDEESFRELILKIQNLEEGKQDNIIYLLGTYKTLVGWNYDQQYLKRGWGELELYRPINEDKCEGKNACICKCQPPKIMLTSGEVCGEKSSDAVCISFPKETISKFIVTISSDKKKGGTDNFEIMGRYKGLLYLEKKGTIIGICDSPPCIE